MCAIRWGAFVAAVVFTFALDVPAQAQVPTALQQKSSSKAVKKVTPVSQLAPAQELTPEQLALASRIALGKMPCELSAFVHVKSDPNGPGRFILEAGKRKFFMVPVVSLTGALRLEDPKAGAVWIQLGNKSMLMDQKAGRRLADACVSPEQAEVAKEMERNPAPSLLDDPASDQVAKGYGNTPVAKP